MKEKNYILFKLLRKHTIPLMLLLVAMVLFFINLFNTSEVYAKEQIADVSCWVNVCCEDKVENISFDNQIVSNGENSLINFSDVDVQLNSNSRLEICYIVKNISNKDNVLNFNLDKLYLNNFKIELSVNNESICDFEDSQFVLAQKEMLEIKIMLSIDNIAQNACLDGNLSLVINN